jgi:hypothetical protein
MYDPIDFTKTKSDLLSNAYSLLKEWLPDGMVEGSEYVALNPNRSDSHSGSFKINVNTGLWSDFATGEKGGDLISLYAYLNGKSNLESAKILGYVKPSKKKTPKPEDDRTICLPIPEDAPEPPLVVKVGDKFIKPSRVYNYLDEVGNTLCLVYRINPSEENGLEKKEIRPLTVWRDKYGKTVWLWKGITENRPLYGLHQLAQFPKKKVLVVSGEKCVDAVRWHFSQKFPSAQEWDFIPVTWSGGDQAVKKTDFSPLQGREMVWWADNDMSSKLCMRRLADKYGGRVLHIEQERHKQGWDCADAVLEGLDLSAFISRKETPKFGDTSVPAPIDIFPHVNEKGRRLSTIENMEALIKHYGFDVWYNEISKSKECSIGGKEFDVFDNLNSFISIVKSVCALNALPIGEVKDYINLTASKNVKNPVKEWFSQKKWDGKPRLKQICDAVICDKQRITNDFKETLIKKWFISACAAASRKEGDNFRTRGVLVFQGKQWIGKTTFFRRLCGAEWGGTTKWFGEGQTLNAEDVDSKMLANKHWIVELGELENTTKRSMPALKAFLTNPVNTMRKKYAPEETTFWSRTVYCGTVNQEEFLPDLTGNSRFWCLPVVELADISQIDMQQVWAEVKCMYDNVDKWWLLPEEESILEMNNEEYEEEDAVEHLIAGKLDFDADKDKWSNRTTTEILMDCGIREPKAAQVKKAGYVLRKLLKLSKAPKRGTNGARFYFCPPNKSSEF